MFCENAVAWKLKWSFRKELKHILTFLLHDIRLQKIRPLWWTTTYISPKAKTIQSSVLTHFTSGVSNVTVRIDIKKQNKKEFKLNLQTGVCTWFDLWSSQVTMGSNPVWTCISIHFSGRLFKKVWVYMRESSDIKVGLCDVECLIFLIIMFTSKVILKGGCYTWSIV